MRGLEITAFAKINIGLEVFWRKSTGYHDIESIFQNVSLADPSGSNGRLQFNRVKGISTASRKIQCVPCSHDLDSLRRDCGKKGVSIHVTKAYHPGLDWGRRADAALRLWPQRALRGAIFSIKLARLGAQVASDVPFFPVRGRGDRERKGERVLPMCRGPIWAYHCPTPMAISDARRTRRWIAAEQSGEDHQYGPKRSWPRMIRT